MSLDNLDRLTSYDMVFINGMGLRIVEEQRQQIQQAADKGIPVYTSMATNPANNICNLDSIQQNSYTRLSEQRRKDQLPQYAELYP